MAPSGIRVDLRIGDPGHCGVTAAADSAESRVEDVSRTLADGRLVQEFTVHDEWTDPPDDVDRVFESDEVTRYRERGVHESFCACVVLAEYGCPVSDVSADPSALSFSFYTTDMDTLESVVDVFRDRFDGVQVTELARTQEFGECDPVSIDRARLTDRQREVLETALEMGYFETPKRANAGEVADELGLALSTVSEHLSAGQRKLLSMALEADRNCRS